MKVIININDSDLMGTLTLLRLASNEYASPELDKTAEQCKGKTFELSPEDFGEEGTALKVALCALCLGKCHESKDIEGDVAGDTRMNIMSAIGSESVVYVKVEPNDGKRRFSVTADIAERIVEALPEKYRDKLIGLRKDLSGYVPVFDEATQREWDNELDAYISHKAAWCERYGSE